jgi:HAD superfamily hydrolase (TIGR01509 family)
MPLHCEAYCLAFKEVGLTLDRELFHSCSAGKASETLKKLLDGQNYSGDWRELHQRKKDIVIDLIDSDQFRPLASARLVPLLSRSYRLAVASSGSAISVHRIIRRLSLSDYFEEIVTGEDVKIGKPDPGPFLLVAERMRIAPEKCLVIEDSEAGIEAARRANMPSINVYSFIPQI